MVINFCPPTVQSPVKSLRTQKIIDRINRIIFHNLSNLIKISTVIVSNAKTEVAMARKKGGKCVPKMCSKTQKQDHLRDVVYWSKTVPDFEALQYAQIYCLKYN